MSQPAGHDTREAQALFVVVAVVPFQSFRIGLRNNVVLMVKSKRDRKFIILFDGYWVPIDNI